MNSPAIILLLAPSSLCVWQASRRHAQILASIDPETGGLTELRKIANEWPQANFHILTDLAEEDFQRESVPHLSGSDRKALLARKLDQAWRETPYRRVVIQTQGGLGGQDQLLLSALTVRERIDTLVNLLLEEKCAIAGIHSSALAADTLLRRLHGQTRHLLLINSTNSGSLRQSYFTSAGLRFSRLGYASGDTIQRAIDVAEETRRVRQYLTTLRLMDREEQLAVLLLTNDSETSEFAATFAQHLLPDADRLDPASETVAAFARRLGFPADCANWTMLLCIAIARGQITDHYRPESAARYLRLRRLGHGLSLTAGALALAGALLGWQGYREATRLQQSIDDTTRQLHKEIDRNKQLAARLEEITTDQPAAMKAATHLYREYLASWPDIERSAQTVSHTLVDFPLLTIDRFEWRAHTNAEPPAGDGDEITPHVAQDSQAPRSESRRWEIIDLSGRISPFSGDYRAALDQLDRLEKRLGKLPRTTVTQTRMPLDIRPQSSIAQQETALPEKVEFAMRLVIAPQQGPLK